MAQILDPMDESVVMTDIMSVARTFLTATSLSDGRVLIAGGVAAGNIILSASEFFTYLEPVATPKAAFKCPPSEPVPTAAAPLTPTPTNLPAPNASTAHEGGACSASVGGVLLGHLA